MASKRVKNRCYWVAVKSHGSYRGCYAEQLYRDALQGAPDSRIRLSLEVYEARYGPARLSDVHNRDLWPARDHIDAIRAEAA